MSTVEDSNATAEAVREEPVEVAVDSTSTKRKRDDEAEEAPAEAAPAEEVSEAPKKAKVEVEENGATASYAAPVAAAAPTNYAAAPAMTSNGDGQELLVLEIAPDKVGQVIGSKGLIIQEIQTRSGARAFVNQDFAPGVNRQCNITGTAAQVKAAAELINMILTQGPTSIHVNSMAGGPTTTQVVECSQPQVGKIIGTGGATIKELQSKSGARIQIDQDYPPDQPRKINITGTPAAVALGVQLVQNIMAGGNALMNMGMGGGGGNMGIYGNAPPMGMGGGMGMNMGMGGMGMGAPMGMQMNGNEAKQMIEVPKMFVGKIIGRGGENIGMIQRKSGARAMVDQSVPEGMPCKVNITGTPQAVAACVQIIQEIVNGVPIERVGANLGSGMPAAQPYGGMGMGAYGGMGGGMPGMGGNMGMGGMGMPQQQMMPQYGYGYGQNQQMGMPQQQQQPYGGMGAGGYQAYGAAAGVAGQPQGGMYPGAMQGYGGQQGGAMGGMGAAGMGGMQQQPKPAAAASQWSEHKTDEGVTYWYNSSSGVSQWERPKL